MTIKHLVISGGGHTLFQTLGALYQLETKKIFKLEEIESIYATSAGAIIGIGLALKFDWETLNDYILKRPWKDVFNINIQHIFDAYKKKGIYDENHIIKCYKPLFDAKNIPIDINMEDFYKLTKVEFHFYTFETNEYKMVDISYLSHPTLSLLTALHMTCSLPILITPVFIENKCYTDGGISCNYPLNYCIESGKDLNEILGFKNICTEIKSIITTESNLFQFIFNFLYKAIFSINTDNIQPKIKNEVICYTDPINLEILKEIVHNFESRKKLFESGIEFADNFLLNIENELIEDNNL
jgi:predicted acylesterase/phospholipase RssA